MQRGLEFLPFASGGGDDGVHRDTDQLHLAQPQPAGCRAEPLGVLQGPVEVVAQHMSLRQMRVGRGRQEHGTGLLGRLPCCQQPIGAGEPDPVQRTEFQQAAYPPDRQGMGLGRGHQAFEHLLRLGQVVGPQAVPEDVQRLAARLRQPDRLGSGQGPFGQGPGALQPVRAL